ncbi:hypothetical protein V5E97_35455 [Singulisphaera sp. Ch08]|uniref:Alpha/beta hydrolase n=1 Tax=Singulisphaera sp. Ch08 TaxID=3120278 RepID=A0AAU7CEE6_9BACT
MVERSRRPLARVGAWLVICAAAWLVVGSAGIIRAQEPAAAPIEAGERPRIPVPLPLVRRNDRDAAVASPGLPPNGRRPLPGSRFDPGASGPGIGSTSSELFLGGALDPRSGWPFVFLHYFSPKPEQVERFWIVQTRNCPQVMGSDPLPCLKLLHFDDRGDVVQRDPSEMLAQTVGRPVFIQVQGSLTTPDIALGGLLWSRAWLLENRALPPDAVVIAFDWPSQRVYQNDVRDINEKGRRAYIAGFHLARFLQQFPPESRITVLGQSYGGRVVPSALYLLGGGCLDSQSHDTPVRLPGLRPDLHIRAICIEGASDHHWLDPDQRLERALYGCEALLNLYNRKDEALLLNPFLRRGGHHRALGRIGLKPSDLDRLGPLAAKYEEHDTHEQLGVAHTLLDTVANRQCARWMAPYLCAPDPGPIAARPSDGPIESQRRDSLGQRLFGR